MKAVIVIPTIRESSITQFLKAWDYFPGHTVIVVEDNPIKTFHLPNVTHVSWQEIDEDLGKDAWIIPRRTDAIRNYGLLLANRIKPDMIVTLDDDCLPWESSTGHRSTQSFLNQHWQALQTPGVNIPVFDTMFSQNWAVKPRGFPCDYGKAKTVLNHGLWNEIPDLDGDTQLEHPQLRSEFPHESIQVPRGVLFPMCGMNVAFRPEILPLMYWLPMGQNQPYHRFADIWCGLIAKKVCDYLGYSVRSGYPIIRHSRASDAKRNQELEALGKKVNERLWKEVMETTITPGMTLEHAVTMLVEVVARSIGLDTTGAEQRYWDNLAGCYRTWVRLSR